NIFSVDASHYGATYCWRRKHWRKLKSLDICLKTLVLDNYRGLKSQINFATFFIRNATKLENMIFTGGRSNGNAYFIARQQKLLEFEKRASKTAHFHFTTKKCYYDWVHIKDVHDLSIADPFECTC
ncbi:Os07g0276000, partial [Oryza sativa Japonica Group]